MTIEGHEVFLTKPQFAAQPKLTSSRDLRMLAASAARRYGAWPTRAPLHVLTHEYAFDSRAAAREFEDFFYDRRGQWGTFWTPGWHAELKPQQTLSAGATSLAIAKVNYSAVYLPGSDTKRLGRYIYLLNTKGQMHVTKVTAAAAGDPEILTFETAVPGGVSFIAGSYHVGLLYFVRFMNDRIAMQFAGPELATTQVQFVETLTATASTDT